MHRLALAAGMLASGLQPVQAAGLSLTKGVGAPDDMPAQSGVALSCLTGPVLLLDG